jgi:mono/diheme cytochrome c family protein
MKWVSKNVIALAGLAFAAPMFTFAADTSNGRREYEQSCAICHGVLGDGKGWLAESLKQPVPSLTKLKKTNAGVFPVEQVYQVIDGRKEIGLHGPRHMPVWGQAYFTRAQRELGTGYRANVDDEIVRTKILALIEYISQLQE